MATAIWWIRRDLRLTDNQALAAAMSRADQVVPVFVLDPALLERHREATKRVAFLLAGLRQLDADLRERGSRLIVRRGEVVGELARLLAETGARTIFAEEDFSPYARERDERVRGQLPLTLIGGPLVHLPGSVLKADGTPYVVFTPFSRKWKALPPPDVGMIFPAPHHISTPTDVNSVPLPEEPAHRPAVPFPPGEGEAQRRLAQFAEGPDPPIYRYAETRDRLDVSVDLAQDQVQTGTSLLSPYLRFGMLSARLAVVAALEASAGAPDEPSREGSGTWLSELIWREFYIHVLYHFPYALDESFRANLRDLAWEDDERAFAAWCEGRTGYPVVDAGMRQLVHTGWMHNRARMIVASFLVKDLLINWQWGEAFFMEHLIDGDPAANNGGWQWSAGTGTDAVPYFRIFNPISQSKRHDPQGEYVRRWVGELAPVPDQYVHQPWTMPAKVQQETGCVIGEDYPAPIVDHAWARERTLAAYKQARKKD